ncbi:PhoU domain-containing protein [Bacillus sp. D-CC]
MKTATDLERIADHAVNIAKSTIRLGEKDVSVSLHNLDEMFTIAMKILLKSLATGCCFVISISARSFISSSK